MENIYLIILGVETVVNIVATIIALVEGLKKDSE